MKTFLLSLAILISPTVTFAQTASEWAIECENLSDPNKNPGRHSISVCTKAIDLNPKDSTLFLNRGVGYYALGNHLQAIKDYNIAIKLNPKFAKAFNNLGTSYYYLENYPEAIKNFTLAAKYDPDYAQAFFNRAATNHYLGYYKSAVEDYYRSLKAKGDWGNRSPSDARLGISQSCKEIPDFNLCYRSPY